MYLVVLVSKIGHGLHGEGTNKKRLIPYKSKDPIKPVTSLVFLYDHDHVQ